MAFTAYGTDYPKIQLWADPGTGSAMQKEHVFSKSDLCYIEAIQPSKEYECDPITLEDDTKREFVRGYRPSWELKAQCPTSNTLAEFVIKYMLPWLYGDATGYKASNGYSDWLIYLWPHKDYTTTVYSVRIVGDVDIQYWNRQWINGFVFRMLLESKVIYASPPYIAI